MFFGIKEYEIGDLIVFLQSLEWDNISAIEGEIGIIISIFDTGKEDTFFDLNVQLADGGVIPVWCGEIEKIKNEKNL